MEGSSIVRHRFYVIKFLDSPNVDIEEYVCVPESWVILGLLHGCLERRAYVAYPSGESRETTSDRVKREEEPWDEWNIYCGLVTYKTDSYDSAHTWIRYNVLNLLSALDFVDTANTEVLDSATSSGPSGCSNRGSPSSSDESKLGMQVPSIKIDPSSEDQNFYKKQAVRVEVAGRSDDVSDLPSTADDFNPIKGVAAKYIGYVSGAPITEEDSKQIIDEGPYDNHQTCLNHHPKIPANSDDFDGYATPTVNQEIPNASKQSCRYESSGKKLLSSVIQGDQDGMNDSMIDRVAAPPGHLHSSSSSSLSFSSVRQSTGENYCNGQNEHFPASSKQGPFYSVFWKKQERFFKYISDDSRSYITENNVKPPPPLTAKNPSISTKQSHLPLPLLNGIMNGRNKENVSEDIQRQVIQDKIPKKHSQKIRNKKKIPSVSNSAFKYYVVQFKDLPDPKMRISNYVCVLKSWITSGLADIELNNVPYKNFEVKVAYPADPRQIPLDFRKLPHDPLKDWKSYRAVIKHITGAYYAAKYWIERKMGISHAPVNDNAADMGGNRPTQAPDSSGSSAGPSPNLPSTDLRKFEEALARCISQPGLTVKKICKRPATSAIVEKKKLPKRVKESTAVYNLSRIVNTPPIIYKSSHTQNRSFLGGQTK